MLGRLSCGATPLNERAPKWSAAVVGIVLLAILWIITNKGLGLSISDTPR